MQHPTVYLILAWQNQQHYELLEGECVYRMIKMFFASSLGRGHASDPFQVAWSLLQA